MTAPASDDQAPLRPPRADLGTLVRFNEKVARLAASGFARRFRDATPEVVAVVHELLGVETEPGGVFHITAQMTAVMEEFDQDEIDAFVLTLRLFTQRNDSVSLHSLGRIYAAAWMPAEARERFEEAVAEVNSYLDTPATVMMEEGVVPVSQIVDVVIYGGLAHTNPAKAELFERWTRSGMGGFIWAEFYAHAKRMLEFVEYFRDLNQAVIDALRGQDPAR